MDRRPTIRELRAMREKREEEEEVDVGRVTSLPFSRKTDIKLYKAQEQNKERLMYILNNFGPVARDTSETGLGKSITTMQLSNELRVPLFVVCPNGVMQAWKDKLSAYNTTYGETLVIDKIGKVIRGEKSGEYSHFGKNIVISYDQLKAMTKRRGTDATYVGAISVGKKTTYRITPMFLELMRQDDGILLVVDESQYIKRKESVQTGVVSALVRAMVNAWDNADDDYNLRYKTKTGELVPVGKHNRVLMLSATPIDDVKHIPIMLYLLGLTDSPSLLEGESLVSGSRSDRNLRQVVYKMAKIESSENGYADTVARIVNSYHSNYIRIESSGHYQKFYEWDLDYTLLGTSGETGLKRALSLAMNLWDTVVVNAFTSETTPFIERNAYKGYFDIGADRIKSVAISGDRRYEQDDKLSNYELYSEGVETLHDVYKSIRSNKEEGISQIVSRRPVEEEEGEDERSVYVKGSKKGSARLSAITLAMGMLEDACFTGACEFLLKKLVQVEDSKVIIGVNRIMTAQKCYEHFTQRLRDLGIRTEVGRRWKGYGKTEVKDKERARSVRKFQEDSNDMRVMIMMMRSGVGIDLHDTSKRGRQRFIVGFPIYEVMLLHQFIGRAARANSTTIAKAYVFYPAVAGTVCESILSSIRQKTVTLESSINPAEAGRSFPSNYDRYIDDGDLFDGGREGYYVDDHLIRDILSGDETGDVSKNRDVTDLASDDVLLQRLFDPAERRVGVVLRDEPPSFRDPVPQSVRDMGYSDGDATYQDGVLYLNAGLIPPTYNTYERGVLNDISEAIYYATDKTDEKYREFVSLKKGLDSARGPRSSPIITTV